MAIARNLSLAGVFKVTCLSTFSNKKFKNVELSDLVNFSVLSVFGSLESLLELIRGN